MALNKKISELTAAGTLTGVEVVPVLQGSAPNPKKTTTQDIANLAIAAAGDVVGPASATGNHLAVFDGATGKLIKDGGVAPSGTNTGDETAASIASLIHAATGKTTPVDADEIPLSDSAASFALKKLTWANLKAGIWSALGALIAAGTTKATPVDGDLLPLSDSAASSATKYLSWLNLKATLKTYFDTLYTASGSAGTVTHTAGALTASALVVGNGTDDAKVLASLGSTTTVLHGNAAGLPTFGAVDLAADVTGNLGVSHLNSGTSASSSTYWRGDGSWATPAGGSGGASAPQGRLCLISGTPIPLTDEATATLYYTPYKGTVIPLWNGSAWVDTPFTEQSISFASAAGYSGHDIFGYLSGGVLAIEALEWKNAAATMTIASPGVVTWVAHGLSNGDTVSFTTTGALPTGVVANTRYYLVNKATDTFQLAATPGGTAINTSGSQSGTHTAHQARLRGTAITMQDRLCKSGDKTRLYLGSVMVDTQGSLKNTRTGGAANSGGKRFVWNMYNEVELTASVYENTAFWSYPTQTWRSANNQVGNRVECFIGYRRDYVIGQLFAGCSVSSTTSAAGLLSVGIDSITTPSFYIGGNFNQSATFSEWQFVTVPLLDQPDIGFHYYQWLERGGDGSHNFLGTNLNTQAGLTVYIKG